jgi:hypothetical protein
MHLPIILPPTFKVEAVLTEYTYNVGSNNSALMPATFKPSAVKCFVVALPKVFTPRKSNPKRLTILT